MRFLLLGPLEGSEELADMISGQPPLINACGHVHQKTKLSKIRLNEGSLNGRPMFSCMQPPGGGSKFGSKFSPTHPSAAKAQGPAPQSLLRWVVITLEAFAEDLLETGDLLVIKVG